MTDEEIQALQVELESTKTELEGVRAEKETLASELETRGAAITELEQKVVTMTAEKEALGVSIKAETQRSIDDLTDSYNLAVSAYKAAVGQANPSVPVELVTGNTIEAIDQSLVSAKTLVAQVRTTIEAELAAGKVPAGAPARTPPDLSALSAREKIKYAIGGKS